MNDNNNTGRFDQNRKVCIDLQDKLWFGKFTGKTPAQLLKFPDGISYLKWMRKNRFTFSPEVMDSLNSMVMDDVPNFMITDDTRKMSQDIEEIMLGEPELCVLGSDQKRTELDRTVRRVIVSSNPEVGRNVFTY